MWWSDITQCIHPEWASKICQSSNTEPVGGLLGGRRLLGVSDVFDGGITEFLDQQWIVHFCWSECMNKLETIQSHQFGLRKWSTNEWRRNLGLFNLQLASELIDMQLDFPNIQIVNLPWYWLQSIKTRFPMLHSRVRLMFPEEQPIVMAHNTVQVQPELSKLNVILREITLSQVEQS